MNCTFYRPEEINIREFENIVGKLAYDLHQLENDKHDEWSVYAYFSALANLVKPLEKNPSMSFLGLSDPASMPSDARVDYFYRPTYLATAFMIKAVLLYPSLMNKAAFLDSELDFSVEDVRQVLAACMLGCTARDFEGAGVLPLRACIQIFEDAGTDEFLKKYPEVCPEFAQLYCEKKAFVQSGAVNIREAWYHHAR